MNTERLQTAMRTLIESESGRPTTGVPDNQPLWIVACWESVDGQVTVSHLASATACLHHLLEAGAFDSGESAFPEGWLNAAASFEARTADLTSGQSHYLAGVGLISRDDATDGGGATVARIALAQGGGLTYERHDGGEEARLQFDDFGPLWWDVQHLLIPLEQYRALVTGDRPHLPSYFTQPPAVLPAPSPAEWPGPC